MKVWGCIFFYLCTFPFLTRLLFVLIVCFVSMSERSHLKFGGIMFWSDLESNHFRTTRHWERAELLIRISSAP